MLRSHRRERRRRTGVCPPATAIVAPRRLTVVAVAPLDPGEHAVGTVPAVNQSTDAAAQQPAQAASAGSACCTRASRGKTARHRWGCRCHRTVISSRTSSDCTSERFQLATSSQLRWVRHNRVLRGSLDSWSAMWSVCTQIYASLAFLEHGTTKQSEQGIGILFCSSHD